jgi:hypothetical protein
LAPNYGAWDSQDPSGQRLRAGSFGELVPVRTRIRKSAPVPVICTASEGSGRRAGSFPRAGCLPVPPLVGDERVGEAGQQLRELAGFGQLAGVEAVQGQVPGRVDQRPCLDTSADLERSSWSG